MGRELRKVPAGWEHPKSNMGYYIPMFDKYYGDALADWIEENDMWEKGTHPDLLERPDLKKECPFFAMWHGNPPDVDSYQTRKYAPEELTHIQLYETTSEGTPISPVFRADELDKLCEWAAENATTFGNSTASKEDWMRMLLNDLVCHTEGNITFI